MVEYAASPLALGTRAPRFSWDVPLTGRNRRQSAYRILVATEEPLLEPGKADLWDSGKVASNQSVNVTYDGNELRSNMDCFWSVQLWDEKGAEVGKPRHGRFGTALFDQADWHAQWIGMGDPNEPFSDPDAFQINRVTPEIQAVEPDPRAPQLRTEFSLGKSVRHARAFVCGLGLFELRMNGRKVGADVLATPRTDFRKRALYVTYDIAPHLVAGANAVGLILGNGWFNGQKKYWGWQQQWYGSPRAIAQIEIEFEDGSTQRVVTDDSWQGDWSPITFNCLYDGEEYDDRLEQPGWDTPGFDAGSWRAVNLVAAPGGTLVPIPHEPEEVVESIRPVAMTEPEPGKYVFDLGRNIAGWIRLKVRGGKPGAKVTLRYAEAIDDRGMVNCASQNRARQIDYYTLKGTGDEAFEPRFTYHGFQYVEVTGYPGAPDVGTVEGRFARVAVAQTGSFECASAFINNIHACTLQSQLCNIQMGVPTDDTQRPERLGWGADVWATAPEAFFNLWMPRVYEKWIADLRDQQDDIGMVGMIAPQAGAHEDIVWSAAFLMVPWWQYIHCGDRRILDVNYPSFQRYIEYLGKCGTKTVASAPTEQFTTMLRHLSSDTTRFSKGRNRGHLQISQWGDHLATAEGFVGRSNLPLSVATAFYYLDVTIMAKIAAVLGNEADACRYRERAVAIRDAFNARFFDPAVGYYDTGVQSAQAWPLVFGLVPEEQRQQVFNYLRSGITDRQRRLTTGYVGTRYAIEALSQGGADDVVWRLATATEYPSWGFMLRKNRTTSCERWDGERGSFNHAALGAAIDEWFYWGLAGIRPDETDPGFAHTIIKPYIPPDLAWARASVRSVRGEVVAGWRKDGARTLLTVGVPANASATVWIPSPKASSIREGDVPATEAEGVALLREEERATIFKVGSGTYCFSFTNQ